MPPSPQDFVHLHVHSEYSLLDGVSHFDPLFDRVQSLGMDAVALTDHGNLFGALQFYKGAKARGIKPIIGCEVYVSPTTRHDRESPEARAGRHHLILLAKNHEGYLNLCRLVSKGYLEGFYHRPRVDKELLEQYKEGLVATSACISGPLAYYLRDNDVKRAEANCQDYIDIFGPEHFYVELMDHGLPEQKKVNEQLLRIARQTGLPMIATNDAHYVHERDARIQDILIAIGTGKTLEDLEKKGAFRFDVEDFFLKSPEDMIRAFGEIEGAIANTRAIAEMCETEIKMKQPLLPEYKPPDGMSAEGYLRRLVDEGLKRRYGEITQPLRERADFEIQVIASMGFVDYFLVVWDFINYARQNGIAVGPGRGSGAGSIVAYALTITDLDPIQNKLFFERFLNPERVSMPDFDIDFCPLGRERVIDYVRQKYGEANVANIITFGKMLAKGAVRDVARVQGVPLDTVNRVAKMIPDGPKVTISKSLEESRDFKEVYESDPEIKDLVDTAMKIEGTVRQTGMHAAGVVVSKKPLIDVLPLYRMAGREEVLTQYTMTEVEELGLLKIDFLGLKNLTVIEDCIAMVRENHGAEIDWMQIGHEDHKTYALLQAGDGAGVFQVESSGMCEMLRRAQPSCFEDITALIALYRPGPMDYIPDFCDRKHGKQPITYKHPLMEEALKETYGVMVYQEQVMQIAQRLAGFSMGKADNLRRAMSKKKEKEMADLKVDFVAGCAEKDIPEELAVSIYNDIEKFAAYAFNKAHAAAYAVVTFRTAYLKANYPAEYMAALLTNEIRGGASEKLGPYIAVARDMGLKVLPPDVNESQALFAVVEGNIRFGLAGIKNVGHGPVSHLLEEREQNGPFTSFPDFCERIDTHRLNARAIECLIRAGAMDALEGSRPQKLAVLTESLEMGGAQRELRQSGQTSLFDLVEETPGANGNGFNQIAFPKLPDWTDREKLDAEKELAGIFLSGHPLDRFRADIRSFADTTGATLQTERKIGQKIRMVGLVETVREIITKKGDPMAIVGMVDFEGKWETIVFTRTYEKRRDILQPDMALFLDGKVSRRDRDEENKVAADDLLPVEELRRSRVKAVDLILDPAQLEIEQLEAIRSLLRRHQGKVPLRIRVQAESGEEVLIETASRYRLNPSDAFLKEFEKLDFPKRLKFAQRER